MRGKDLKWSNEICMLFEALQSKNNSRTGPCNKIWVLIPWPCPLSLFPKFAAPLREPWYLLQALALGTCVIKTSKKKKKKKKSSALHLISCVLLREFYAAKEWQGLASGNFDSVAQMLSSTTWFLSFSVTCSKCPQAPSCGFPISAICSPSVLSSDWSKAHIFTLNLLKEGNDLFWQKEGSTFFYSPIPLYVIGSHWIMYPNPAIVTTQLTGKKWYLDNPVTGNF